MIILRLGEIMAAGQCYTQSIAPADECRYVVCVVYDGLGIISRCRCQYVAIAYAVSVYI